jgi:hypothetical protein
MLLRRRREKAASAARRAAEAGFDVLDRRLPAAEAAKGAAAQGVPRPLELPAGRTGPLRLHRAAPHRHLVLSGSVGGMVFDFVHRGEPEAS